MNRAKAAPVVGTAFATFGEMRGILFMFAATAAMTAAAGAVTGASTGSAVRTASAVGAAYALLALLFGADNEEHDSADNQRNAGDQ